MSRSARDTTARGAFGIVFHAINPCCCLVLLSCAFGMACGLPPQVAHPDIPERSAPEAERRAVYEQNALHEEPWGLGRVEWRRADGQTRSMAELETLAERYPETREVRSEISWYGLIDWLTIPGLGLLVGTGVHDLAGATLEDWEGPSRRTANTLYIVGGSMLAVGILLKLLIRNPAEDFADAYNRGLREELGLAAPEN